MAFGSQPQVYKFGTGSLFGISTSASGIATPRQFGALQDVSLDFQFTNKELYGQYIFPLAIARGQAKVTGKAKYAQIQGGIYDDLFFGSGANETATQVLTAINETAPIPATPYAITVTHSTNWTVDRGVIATNGGQAFTKVASGPTTGQYSVAAGVYTFAAADTGVSVSISYDYSSTAGVEIVYANTLQGVAPTFQIKFATTYNSQQCTYQLNACI
ncbi:MAG: hypothetical protein ACREJM_01770, partial [Candidatus Saccharimonadales bacterium]